MLSRQRLVWVLATAAVLLAVLVIALVSTAPPTPTTLAPAPPLPPPTQVFLPPNVMEHKSENYVVHEIYNVLTPQECDDLIAHAKDRGLEESMVWDYGQKDGNTYDKSHRRSKQTWLPYDHPITHKLSKLSEMVTGLPAENQELLQVAMYEQGGRFNEHYDACDHEDAEYCDKMNHSAGERRSTLLVYLNDGFEGGNTEFVNTGINIRPKKGHAILFWNTANDGDIISDSKHRGHPVTSGEKWIATVWTHQRAYPQTQTDA